MTFRQQCAVAAMRELVARGRMAALPDDDVIYCTEIARASFIMADAMVAAAGPEPATHGAAPSRTAGT